MENFKIIKQKNYNVMHCQHFSQSKIIFRVYKKCHKNSDSKKASFKVIMKVFKKEALYLQKKFPFKIFNRIRIQVNSV
jgi:hypothetical protein